MKKPETVYTQIAYETIYNKLNGIEKREYANEEIPEILKERRGCFVTIHNNDGSLRGCIGTIMAVRKNLLEEIRENAIASATRDYRFFPMTSEELENVYISVDVLSDMMEVENISELDVKKYGVLVTYNGKRGVLLPDLDGVDTVKQQLEIAASKAGMTEAEKKRMKIEKFTVDRYY